MPPMTLYQSVSPARASALITVLERSPPAHRTALGRPSGTRSLRASASPIGTWSAPSLCPSPHSTGSRTAMTTRAGAPPLLAARARRRGLGGAEVGHADRRRGGARQARALPLGHAPLQRARPRVEADAAEPL